MDDGSADGGVAVTLEVQDELAHLAVRRGHPHRACAVEVLEDLQRAEEDLGRVLRAAAAVSSSSSSGGGGGGGSATSGRRGCAQALERKVEDVAYWRRG